MVTVDCVNYFLGAYVMLMWHTHTRSFNGPLSMTAWVSRYQKKHSPIRKQSHEEEEKGFVQTTRSALSQ